MAQADTSGSGLTRNLWRFRTGFSGAWDTQTHSGSSWRVSVKTSDTSSDSQQVQLKNGEMREGETRE